MTLKTGERQELDELVSRIAAAWQSDPHVSLETLLPAGDESRQMVLQELMRRFPERQTELEAALSSRGRPPDAPAETHSTASAALNTDPFQTQFPTGFDKDEPRPPAVGTIFGTRYANLGELGRGGMGVVYRALDRQRNQVVALKTLQWIDAAALLRFKQEFRALADVVHPNLVTLYESFSDGQHWCFSMEYVTGVDFLSYVRPATVGGELDLSRLRNGLHQLVEGIAFLHGAGKLHRDIKPHNILVTEADRVVLLDFGLAAELEQTGLHHSASGHVIGTCAYMAPEQAAGKPVSTASDWYSVGVTLYQALTGELPFTGGWHEIIRDKQLREPPPPNQLCVNIPGDLNDLCVELLRQYPSRRPIGSEILARLEHDSSPPQALKSSGSTTPLQTSKLIGRDSHRRVLNDAFDSVQQGRTVMLVVQGQSGAGKSALVQSFLDDLVRKQSAAVLRGKCYEQESMPFKALDSLIDSLSRYLGQLPVLEAQVLLPRDVASLVRLFPVLGHLPAVTKVQRAIETPDPHELRRRAIASLRELLARIGDRRPLVLVIDDLQWGDADSASVLVDLLRPPDPPVMLLIAVLRSEDFERSPVKPALEQLQQQGSDVVLCQSLTVDPLSADESRELAQLLLTESGRPVTGDADTIGRESAGNPFFVHELVRHLALRGKGPADLPATGTLALDSILFERVEALPAKARRLLETVAVAGRPLPQHEAFAAADFTSEQSQALAQLRAERFLRTTGGDEMLLVTFHDRVREAIVTRLPQHRLVHHHQALAAVLETSPLADAEEVAVHFEASGNRTKACEHYTRAAERAADVLAFQRAASLYRKALEMQPPGSAASTCVRTHLAQALANAGRGVEAAEAYIAAAAEVESAQGTALRQEAAMQLLISGQIDQGVSLLRDALMAVGLKFPRTPERALVALIGNRLRLACRSWRFRERSENDLPAAEIQRLDACWAAVAGLSCVDTIRAAYFQSKQMLLALAAGEPRRVVRALALEIGHVSVAGEAAQRQVHKLLELGDRLSQPLDDPYCTAVLFLARAIAAGLSGHWKECQNFGDRGEEILRTRCRGGHWELDTLHRFVCWSLAYQGQMAELNRRLPVLIQEARERGNLYAETNLSTFVLPALRLAADDPQRAREELRDSMSRWTQEGFHVQHLTRVYDEAVIDMYQGDGLSALACLDRFWPAIKKSQLLRVVQLRIFLVDARARSSLSAALQSSDPQPFVERALRDAARLAGERDGYAQALAVLIRAGAAQIRGQTAESAKLLMAAISRFDEVDLPLHAAVARIRLATLIDDEPIRIGRDTALTWMAQQEIRNPERITALVAPGSNL